MDIKKLRQKILDLAISGKLVPQNPNDEPASVLLERIRAEKERLIAEGKIKRPKKSKSSSAESHYRNFPPPFPIPDSWMWVRLEDICKCISDGDHQAPPKSNSGVPFLVISDIITGKICFDKCRYVTEDYFKKLEDDRKPTFGDILFTVTGSLGKSVIVNTQCEFCFQRHIGLLKPMISSSFLDIVLSSDYIQKECKRKATGTAQKTISLEVLRNFLIPIPPNDEQLKIVELINSFEDNIDAIISNVDTLRNIIKKAKFKILDLAMQGKLVPQDPADEPAADMLRRVNPKAKIIIDNPHSWNIPSSWTWCYLGDIFQHNTGKALNSSNKDGIDYEYITTSNVYWGRFVLGDLNKMPFKENEIEKCTVCKGDLLVCEGGDVGRAAIWNLERNIMIQNHLHRLRPLTNEICTTLYFHVFRLYKDRDLIGGKGIALQGFSSKSLHHLIVPLPPSNEQKRIAIQIEELYSILDVIEASLQS